MGINTIITSKLTSARFILTVVCSLVFAYLACAKILTPEASLSVLMIVFSFYFTRPDRQTTSTDSGTTTTDTTNSSNSSSTVVR